MTFHPGLILILSGFLALVAPKTIRKIVMVGGPFCALLAAMSLPLGTDFSFEFINGMQLGWLHVDKLSWLFTFIFCVLAFIASVYGCHNTNRMEALCALAYAGGGIGVCLAKDWMTLIFFWEALAISSVFLVWCNKTKEARKAAFRYILVHMLGGNLLLAGIFLKVNAGEYLVGNIVGGPHDLAYWLILIGFFVNVAMPPVNAWLVDAYSNSTITGGVFMSCLTTKVAVYVLVRVFGGMELLMWGGALMALYGACYAIMENDMRKLLAHHIISQTGFMVAGAGIGTAMGMNGATAHAFCDILFKSLLFMCAGSIMYATGIKHINKLAGMKDKMPITCICFFVAAFSISGIPLFNGFVSKMITVNAAAAAGHDLLFTLLEIASIGTFLSIPLKMGYFIFLRKDVDKHVEIVNPLPKNMEIGMILGAIGCVLYGVYPDLLYRHFAFDMTPYVPFTASHIFSTVEMLGMALIPFMMYLNNMEPHTAISLDTDWFYRKPFAGLVHWTSGVLCAVCGALGGAWWVLYQKFMELMSNPMDFLDARPFREAKRYHPRNYRTSIADPMMIILTVLTSVILYLINAL